MRAEAVNSIYSNGSSTIVGIVGMAIFANETALKEIGMNQYLPTPKSGAPALGRAGEPILVEFNQEHLRHLIQMRLLKWPK